MGFGIRDDLPSSLVRRPWSGLQYSHRLKSMCSNSEARTHVAELGDSCRPELSGWILQRHKRRKTVRIGYPKGVA
jgi:hypothetical protein